MRSSLINNKMQSVKLNGRLFSVSAFLSAFLHKATALTWLIQPYLQMPFNGVAFSTLKLSPAWTELNQRTWIPYENELWGCSFGRNS